MRSFSDTDTDRNGFSSRRFFGSQVSANTKCKTCMLLTEKKNSHEGER